MKRRRRGVAWGLGLAVIAGGCFVEDELPVGPGGDVSAHEGDGDAAVDPEELGALGGEYEAELRTIRCEGDCVGASTILGPATFCDVGDVDFDTVEVWQEDLSLTMDVSQGRLRGTIDDEGAFDVQGTSTESGGQLAIDMAGSGRFTGRHEGFAAAVRFSVVGEQDGNRVDCHGELEVVATWESDLCNDDADACPGEYPICVNDGCYAGVEGDPCGSDDECTGGLRCGADGCTQPVPADGPCAYDDDCATGLQCVQMVCSAGEPGDACVFADDCPAGFCIDSVCTAGAPGDPCNADWDCAAEYACYEGHCYLGVDGEPCNVGSECESGICYASACSSGTAGSPCTWDHDCAAGLACIEDVCG